MAGRGDIQAGRAFVSLTLKDGLTKGLRNASQRLKSFGSGAAVMGGAMTAAGTVIAGTLLKAVQYFSDVGSELNDMSARTGIAASKLSELGYAASQSGSSMEAVEGAVRKMQKTIGDAANGSKSATEALNNLGLSMADLEGLSPDEQFQKISDKIAAIEDPTKKAAAAMSVFGKSGTGMLPMIGDLASLRAEFAESGLGPTDEEVKRADELGDAFGKLKAFAGGLVFKIGSILAEEVMKAVTAVTDIVSAVGKWVKDNRALVLTVFKVAGAVALAGAAITGIGLAIAGAGVVLGGLATGLAAVGAVLGAILSPLGLITAALVGGAYVWARYTASGQAAVTGVMSLLGSLAQTFKQTFGGIADAIMSGDLASAGGIAIAGLRVALLQGISAISAAVGGAFGDFLGTIGAQIAGGDLAGAWETAVINMAAIWDGFVEGLVAVFTKAARGVTDLWLKTTTRISNFLLKNGAIRGVVLAGTGIDLDDEQRKAEKLRTEDIGLKQRQLVDQRGNLATAQAQGGSFVDSVGQTQTTESIQRLIEDLEESLATLGSTPVDVIGDAQKIAAGQLAGTANSIQLRLDKIDLSAQAKTRASAGAAAAVNAGGAGVADEALATAQAELDALTEKAAAARRKNDEAKAEQQAVVGEVPETGGLAAKVAGSFSAAALSAMGQGGNPQIREQRKTNDKLTELIKASKDTLAAVKLGGVVG